MGVIADLQTLAEKLENKAKELNPPKAIKCPRCGSTDFINNAEASKSKTCCICMHCSKKWEV